MADAIAQGAPIAHLAVQMPHVHVRILRRWGLALLVMGLAWRAIRYFLQFPMWGDEAFVGLNFLDHSYIDLTGRLQFGQVAPILFLWGELTALRLLGPSELALRLLPFLAGIGSLFLFARLLRRSVGGLAQVLAMGFLAVAIWPVSMGAFVKPYAFDLFMSLALLTPAIEWLRRPERVRYLAMLVIIVPVAMLASYPAVFIAGAVSAALLPAVLRRPSHGARLLYVAFNLAIVAAFVGSYWLVGSKQVNDEPGIVNQYLQEYWAEGFPPIAPMALIKWLFLTHTGQMMAYPVGAAHGGSIVTFLLFAAGVARFWRSRRRAWLVLFLGPFALGLIAAALHKYPYGCSCRLSQHLAPVICLLAGTGAASLLERIHSVVYRRRWIAVACACFLMIGAGGLLRDVLKPYRSQGDEWTRRVVDQVFSKAHPNDQIVVLNDRNEIKPLFQWFLAQKGARVEWHGRLDENRLEDPTAQIWCLHIYPPESRDSAAGSAPDGQTVEQFKTHLAQSKTPWTLVDRVPYTVIPSDSKGPIERCDVYHWVRQDHRPAIGRVDPLSSWP